MALALRRHPARYPCRNVARCAGWHTLAAMNVPQALGYARIAGMPVVTGLCTLLLPLVAFAALGSSRYLVVAADSATARPSSRAGCHRSYLLPASTVKCWWVGSSFDGRMPAAGAVVRDSASWPTFFQTVLVGFLTGVGFQVGIGMLGEMLGVPSTPIGRLSSRRSSAVCLTCTFRQFASRLRC